MIESNRRKITAIEGLAFCSLKSLINWGDDLKVDQSNIDTQHEKIFTLALEASELARDPAERLRLRSVFAQFGEVLKAHFQYEEMHLAEIAYPQIDEHRAEHAEMLAEFEFIGRRLAGNGTGWAFQGESLVIINFMLGVTAGHILHSDSGYARFMSDSANLPGNAGLRAVN